MSRVVAVFVAAGVLALVAGPAAASSGERAYAGLSGSTWYSATAVSVETGTGGPPVTLSDPTVPEGDLAVAGPEEGGEPAKETYLAFDLSGIPSGATIVSFRVTLPVDPKGTTVLPSGVAPPIVACTPGGSWSPGPGDRPVSEKPPDTCAPNAPRVVAVDHGKAYTVDLAPIARGWTEVGGLDLGAAITNDPANTSTAYQVVFGPPNALRTVRALVTYLPPVAGSPAGTTSGATPGGVGGARSGTGAGSAQGALASAPKGPGSSPTPVLAPPPVAAYQGASPPGPVASPSPSPTSSVPAPPPTRKRGGSGLVLARVGYVPPVGFFVVGLLLALLLALVWAVLSAPVETSAGELRGIGRLLRRRGALELFGTTPSRPAGGPALSRRPTRAARAGDAHDRSSDTTRGDRGA